MASELDARLAASSGYEEQLDALRRYRNEEFLRIGINDIHGLLEHTAARRQLSNLAEVSLEGAYQVALRILLEQHRMEATPGRLAVIAMGKLGEQELNYNSDLDLLFIYEPEERLAPPGLTAHEFFTRLAQRLITTLQVQTKEGHVYKIDTRLRPSGRAGSLVSSLPAFIEYHKASAQVWERQALIKARAVAGDPDVGRRVEEVAETHAYGGALSAEDVREIHRLRVRMEEELANERKGRLNIKTGRGGIVDIEFIVQMLQLRHGRALPQLRHRGTAVALEALRACAIVSPEDFVVLSQGYEFLRALENRLRIERDRPVEALEEDEEKLVPLARRMGYEGEDGAGRLLDDYRRRREEIRGCYHRAFAREAGLSSAEAFD